MVSAALSEAIEAVRRHLALGAVAVVGAGLSFDARFPLTDGLTVLLWNALDHDAPGRLEVADALGKADAASKQLVGDDPTAVALAWSALRRRNEGRHRLQTQFAALDRERSVLPSPAHEALARLVHAQIVECVVSLNWDTAFERAYERLFGVPVPRGVLFKPHGDAAKPNLPWVFPDEPGVVTPEIEVTAATLAAGHARSLLVIGYSGSDAVVVDRLLEPLGASWRTIRVSPNATDDDDLQGSAVEVLGALAEPLAARLDSSAWHTVTFDGIRGMRSAFRGERLSPLDVDACPELAESQLIFRSLLEDRAVVLNGPTGSGKSISAYQALRKLSHEGYQVLRLRDDARTRGVRNWLTDLRHFPWPKVLFVDDAQDLTPDAVREFSEHADSKTLILFAGIDHVAGGVRTLQMGSSAAVARLARWVRDNPGAAFAEARALDDQLGRDALDIHFENRLRAAEAQPTPWLFFYILTGGWRRIGRELLELRDADRADLLLLVIAVAQIAGVDAGVALDDLGTWSKAIHRDAAWTHAALTELRHKSLLNESDGRIRCAHLETAYSVVRWMLHAPPVSYAPYDREVVPPIQSAGSHPAPPRVLPRRPPASQPELSAEGTRGDREAVGAAITHALESDSTPFRGLAWLVGGSMPSDVLDQLRLSRVLDGDGYLALATRALDCSAEAEIASAADLLTETLHRTDSAAVQRLLVRHDATLRNWYSRISSQNGWALGNLANGIYHIDRDLAAAVSGYADPARLAGLIPDGGWPHSSSTGRALDRLCNVGGASVRKAVQSHLVAADYEQMLQTGDPELWRICSMLEDVVSLDHRLALSLFELVSRRLAAQFSADPVREWNNMGSLMIHFGAGPTFLRGGRSPLREVTRAIRGFTGTLDRVSIARALENPTAQWGQLNFGEFISLLDEFDKPTLNAVVDLVNLDRFESGLATEVDDLRGTPMYAALSIAEYRPDEVLAILDRLEPSWTHLDPLAVYCAPATAVRALKRGLPLDLSLDHHHWGLAASIVERLHEVDASVAAEVIRANQTHMRTGLIASRHHEPWEDLAQWIEVCDRVLPGHVETVIATMPPEAIAQWARGLRRPRTGESSRKAEIAPLVYRAASLPGAVGQEAARLLVRFPAAARYAERLHSEQARVGLD